MHALIVSLLLVACSQPPASAGGAGSPLSWSPDGRWLAFVDRTNPADPIGRRYRVWAARVATHESVLIEESAWPRTAPVWGPRGRLMAYGRFTPGERPSSRELSRGRYEVVIREGFARERVIVVKAPFVLDPGVESSWGLGASAWSSDGAFLAVPVPGAAPALAVIRVPNGRVETILAGALEPSWSPDGRRLAYLAADGESLGLYLVERKGTGLAPARKRLASGLVHGAPRWAGDGGSLYAARSKPGPRGDEVELASVFPDRDSPTAALSMGFARRGETGDLPTAAFDVVSPSERCLLAARQVGDETALIYGSAAEHHVYKRFHPIDAGIGIATLALAPDGVFAAFRVEGDDGFGGIALLDLATETTWLVTADLDALRGWRSLLAGRARAILKGALTERSPAGELMDRPAGLPAPGELDARPDLIPRIARLARLGASLHDPDPGPRPADPGKIMDKLLLEALDGDHKAALASIEALEPLQYTAAARADRLGLKAQVLWSGGNLAAARALVQALVEKAGETTKTIEDTTLGPVVAARRSPGQAWLHLMNARMAAEANPEAATDELEIQASEPEAADPFAPERPVFEHNDPAQPLTRRRPAPTRPPPF